MTMHAQGNPRFPHRPGGAVREPARARGLSDAPRHRDRRVQRTFYTTQIASLNARERQFPSNSLIRYGETNSTAIRSSPRGAQLVDALRKSAVAQAGYTYSAP